MASAGSCPSVERLTAAFDVCVNIVRCIMYSAVGFFMCFYDCTFSGCFPKRNIFQLSRKCCNFVTHVKTIINGNDMANGPTVGSAVKSQQ